jgi:signal transduction histidine kinase
MYVALYDAPRQELSFPLALYDGEREDWPSRKVNIEDETEGGLTEEVIRAKEPVCPTNVKSWYTERGIEPPVLPIPKSWLGVPLMTEDEVLGVIALQNDDIENLYGQDDRTVLQAMADQATIALDNTRLYDYLEDRVEERTHQLKKAQAKIAEKEAVLIRTSIAADFVHRINNLAGTIPVWVDLTRERLEEKDLIDSKLTEYLDNIEKEASGLLRGAEMLCSSSRKEKIDIKEMLQGLVRQALVQMPAEIDVELECEEFLPAIYAVRTELANAFWNVIENGIEAMPQGGLLLIEANVVGNGEWIKITISDEGEGISKEEASKVFQPFYSTKEGHTGYGLWRAKNVFERLGGEINLRSEEVRTTFIIKLPCSRGG